MYYTYLIRAVTYVEAQFDTRTRERYSIIDFHAQIICILLVCARIKLIHNVIREKSERGHEDLFPKFTKLICLNIQTN